ncbi:MAG: hypothetical protein XD73_0623 [Anaerolinea thermophila]|uniref:Oxidoreductase molybdopterin-binding domain-containing protein n=1 Tax=Anaerolinea thermophila TaxID=167964 RepID=A0A101FY53_9CHLR|nr:MAG: hypothetical protein XD73_0623 [Anaerolinea thermophila]
MERKELETTMQQQGRLPPGQTPTLKFPVLHYGSIPPFDPQTWTFRIWGEVEKEVSLSWQEFTQLPRVSMLYDLHCVTRWSKFNTRWDGVLIQTLIKEDIIQPTPHANFMIQYAEHGFSANLPLEIALSRTFLLATHFEGQPITPEHGFPLRGLVGAIPGDRTQKDVYLWKGAKWLRALEFSSEDKPGFWEQAGYHNDANIWEEQRLA